MISLSTGIIQIKTPNTAFTGQITDKILGQYGMLQTQQYEYVGQFNENCQKHGYGKITYKDKDITYEGYWNQDIMHGIGIQTVDKERYVGEFVNGQKTIGKLTSEQGAYEGEFKNDQLNGIGVMNGRDYVYKGQLESGLYHGTGFYKNATEIYEGEFNSNKYHGRGILQRATGESCVAEFANGRIITTQ